MAIPKNMFGVFGTAQVVAIICQRYGIESTRFTEVHQVRDVSSMQDTYEFTFAAARQPPALRMAMEKISEMLNDEFRGPVLAAAVPELYAAQRQALKQFMLAGEKQSICMSESSVYELMESRNGKF